MEYITLYRKYRPKNFAELYGQEYISKSLKNAIKLDKISHAYIFCGSHGIGKTSIAKIFAKSLNCLHPVDGDACCQCDNCKLFDSNTTDIIELDAASNNGVDNVRELISSINYQPTTLKKKVYIIDEVHMLTTAGWNAFLKTVEEPPKHVVIIFATTEINKIPSTILSRCQIFNFKKLVDKDLMDMVVDVCKKENISIDKESIEKIISLSNGAARDCLTMLDQMNLNTNSNITAVDIDNVFGLVDDNNKIKLLNFIKQNNAQCIIDMTKSFDEIGVNFSLLTNSLITIILDKIIMFATNNHDILKTNIQLLNSFDYSKEECLKVINELQTLSINLKNCHSPKTYFEICILNCFNIFSDFDNDLKVNAINSNLDLNTIQQPIINTIQQPIINNIHKDFYKVTKIIHKYPDTNIDTSLSIEIPQINTTTSNNNVISLNTQIQKIIIDPLSLFKMIANNYSKAHMIEAKNLINTIKNSYNLNKLNYISSNKEVLVASENGIVLLFENETDAELLNNNAIQKDFLLELSKFINHPKYIIGFSFEQKDTIVKEFEKTINEKTPEPDISQLEEVLNSINITNDIDDFFV